MDLKKTAKRLLNLAERIKKEASDNSYFICENCNHTATLTDINERRVKLASAEDPEMEVKEVTVNDKISCPACEGTMSYVTSGSSEKYYIEAEEEKMPEEETEMESEEETSEEEKPVKKEKSDEKSDMEDTEDVGEDIDIDKLFEDVETQNQKAKGEEETVPEDTSSTLPPEAPMNEPEEKSFAEKMDTPTEEETPEEEPAQIPEEEESEEETSKEEMPEEESEDEKPIEEDSIEEESVGPEGEEEDEVFEKVEEEPKKKKKKKDKPDDGIANIDKKEVPKFKSEEAAQRFAASYERYSI